MSAVATPGLEVPLQRALRKTGGKHRVDDNEFPPRGIRQLDEVLYGRLVT